METVEFKISDLLDGKTDQISGRQYGKDYCVSIKLLDLLSKDVKVIFNIDSKVKAINDSFIKGLFSEIFKKYKTIKEVSSKIEIQSNSDFKTLFEKNWQLLQAIYNV
jgi:hypothetical protein